VAEVAFEESSIVELAVIGNILSFSPSALPSWPLSARVLVSSSAVNDSSDVLSDILWGTEWLIWNNLGSISEGAEGWAIFS